MLCVWFLKDVALKQPKLKDTWMTAAACVRGGCCAARADAARIA